MASVARKARRGGLTALIELRRAVCLASAAALAGCSVGPDYVKPAAPVPVHFKELKGWKPAVPRDAADRGAWWAVYHDPVLDGFERQVDVSNQNVRAAEANFRQAVAIIKEAQAGLFPTISADYTGTRSHEGSAVSSARSVSLSSASTSSTSTSGGTTSLGTTAGSGTTSPTAVSGGGITSTGAGTTTTGTGTTTTGTGTTGSTGTSTSTGVSTTTGGGAGFTINTFALEASASYDLDVWGRIRRQINGDIAAAQISDADLANARLSAQAQLATAYFDLRAQDSLHQLLTRTASDYQRTLEITQNQYAAGTAARSDVDNALAQLKTTQAQAIATGILRAQYEHAVAVLSGKTPAEVAIATGMLGSRPVVVPPGLPSTLLERRPDVAAAERAMQQENELIGVAASAFYPDLSLSGTVGAVGRSALPLSAANEIWSLGGTAAQTLFDGGERAADVAAVIAAYDQTVANYRQTVLTAMQQVEDDLAALRILAAEAAVQEQAVAAARNATDKTLNEYKAGTVAFTAVITAQATQLGDEVTALGIRQNRYVASVALIEALGGGWTVADLARGAQLRAAPIPPLSSPNLKTDVFTPKPHL